jgi:hypothetical protein
MTLVSGGGVIGVKERADMRKDVLFSYKTEDVHEILSKLLAVS